MSALKKFIKVVLYAVFGVFGLFILLMIYFMIFPEPKGKTRNSMYDEDPAKKQAYEELQKERKEELRLYEERQKANEELMKRARVEEEKDKLRQQGY